MALLVGLLALPAPALATQSFREGTDKAAALFDPLKVVDIKITRTLGGPALTKKYLDFNGYRKANIRIRMAGTTHYTLLMNVGIRHKGSFTRRFEKPSLKISFDQFVKGQKFMGLSRLTLNAMMQDTSHVHEVTAYKLYRAMGIPAPRAGYATVTLDQHPQGMYLNLESIDNHMLKRWFASTAHVYSGPRFCDITPYARCYMASIGDNVQIDLSKVAKMHYLHGKAWWNAFKHYANSDLVIKLMATDIFMSNWDGYTDFARNNHFIHFDKQGKFTIIPWGLDQTFTGLHKFQLNWDGTKPQGFVDVRERSTLWDHCLEYSPCHDRVLHEGFLVAQMAKSIDLVDYKRAVAAVVTRDRYIRNDVSGFTKSQMLFSQSWMESFLLNRESSIRNFLLLRSPIRLGITVPKYAKVGTLIRPDMEQSWEPGTSSTFQWFLNGKAIPGATKLNLRLTHSGKVKLQISLHKNSNKDTVYFSKTIRVS